MNKKGFTTIELILTIVLVVIIMITITNVTYTYRDRSDYEELVTEVKDYKNTVTKIIYDDILSGRVAIITEVEVKNKYKLSSGGAYKETTENFLTIINNENEAGFNYKGVNYLLSDIEFKDLIFKSDKDSGLYSIEIIFYHQILDDEFNIKFAIS